jgi:hypothetical protein
MAIEKTFARTCLSAIDKQVMGIKNRISDGWIFFEAAANGCRYGLPGLPAKPRAFHELNAEAARCAYFPSAPCDLQNEAELFFHAFRDVPQICIGGNILDARDEFFLFLACQAQYANVAVRIIQYTVPLTNARAWRALLANGKRGRLQHGITLQMIYRKSTERLVSIL